MSQATNKVIASHHFNYNHKDFFQCTDREVLFYGSAGSGKSYSVADKLLVQTITQPHKLKILVIRKTLPSLKRTCIPLIEERAALLQIPYKLNRSDFVAKVGDYGSEIVFLSMNHKVDYDKVKSITDLDMVWIEEANELPEMAYDEFIKLRLRGGQGNFKQIIMSFNPISTTSWIYDKFFIRDEPVKKIHTTVYENPFIEQDYIDVLEALKETNYNLYKVYCLGEWGSLKGVIYDNYDIVNLYPSAIDETIYGLDFGFNNPMALVKIMFSDQEVWIEELFYKTGFTTTDMIQKMRQLNVSKSDPIYCDSAEPDRIKELCDKGYNAKPCVKDVNSVIEGINFVKTLVMHYMSNSTNLIKEAGSYSWAEDREGKALDEPVKFMDHLMDAKRYALYTHLRKRTGARARFI